LRKSKSHNYKTQKSKIEKESPWTAIGKALAAIVGALPANRRGLVGGHYLASPVSTQKGVSGNTSLLRGSDWLPLAILTAPLAMLIVPFAMLNCPLAILNCPFCDTELSLLRY